MMTNETTAKTDIIETTTSLVKRIFCESKTTIISAKRLFRKWAKIATKILPVFRYRIEMQIPKIKAENMEPKL
jgi:adenine specific DNA methylase Mod